MDILKYNKTFTTKFILPLLFKQQTDYTELFNNSFINAYLGDIKNKEYDDKVLLVFSDYPSLSITQKLPQSVAEYMADELYVLVYDLPEEYLTDYINFIAGNYSEFSDHTKTRIKSFWQSDKDSIMSYVLDDNKEQIKKYLKEKLNKSKSDDISWFAPIIKYEILGVV